MPCPASAAAIARPTATRPRRRRASVTAIRRSTGELVAIQRASGAGQRATSARQAPLMIRRSACARRWATAQRAPARRHRASARRARRSRPGPRARDRASNARRHTTRVSPIPAAARPTRARRARAAAARRRVRAGHGRGAIARNAARARGEQRRGTAAASGATPAVAASDVHSCASRHASQRAATPIPRSSRPHEAQAPRRRAPAPAQRDVPGSSAAPVARLAWLDGGRRSMAPANAAAPAASHCHGVPRDEFDARFAVPARERRLGERRVDADARRRRVAAPRLSERQRKLGRKRAIGDGASAGKRAAVGPAHEARGIRLARAPSPVGGRSGEVAFGDDACHVRDRRRRLRRRAIARRSRRERARREPAPTRRRDARRWVRRAGLRARMPAAPATRDAGIGGSAIVAMRTCEAASTTSIRSAAGQAAGRSRPLRTQAPAASKSAQASARSAAGARVEQNAQHRHAECSWRARIAVVYSTPSLRSITRQSARRSPSCAAAAASHERPRARARRRPGAPRS